MSYNITDDIYASDNTLLYEIYVVFCKGVCVGIYAVLITSYLKIYTCTII